MVVLAVLGNNSFPLEGVLLDIGRFTPMCGATALARYPPLTDGNLLTPGSEGSLGTDPLWMLLANLIAWSTVFALGCLVLLRRNATRR